MTIASESALTWSSFDDVSDISDIEVVVVHLADFRSIPSRRDVERVMRSNSNWADLRCDSETAAFTENSCKSNEETVKCLRAGKLKILLFDAAIARATGFRRRVAN